MSTVASQEVSGRLKVSLEQIAAFCRCNEIRRLAIFGSILRDDFSDASDIDVLVDFQAGHAPGLQFFHMQDELSVLFGRSVDLHTAGSLSHHFRRQVLSQAEVLYVAE